MLRNIVLFLSFFLVLTSLLTGCGQKGPKGLPEKRTPVTLTIVYDDGSPVDEAIVGLAQSDVGNPWGASGTTNEQGIVVPQTSGQYPDVVPGSYKVTVIKVKQSSTSASGMSGTEVVKEEVQVDPKFGRERTSPLKLEVGDTPVEQKLTVTKPKKRRGK